MKTIIQHFFNRLHLLLVFLFLAGWPLLADTSTNPIRVACVGDSITYGATITNRDRDSYPAQLGKLLGAGWDVRNFGHSGATMLRRADLPYVELNEHTGTLAFKPDVVVIMLGTNDSKHRGDGSLDADNAVMNWSHRTDYIPDYEALIAEFRQVNPRAQIYICFPPPCFPGRWGINDKTIHEEIIPLIRKVAHQTHSKIIDFYSVFSGKKEFFPDTVHPNEAGAKIMATTVYHALTGKKAPQSAGD
jgi:lysophospholipase L1-like esterase